ncbi:hypothetical protein [Terasakiella pusilla]|uniref:hypothetical protein n=1 Tax=Terasakiella pusilla TaxID=64973 RepID=UPI003AA9C5A4
MDDVGTEGRMKRSDYIFLPLICAIALFLGWKLLAATEKDLSGVIIQPIDDIGAFIAAAEQIQPKEGGVYLLAQQWKWSGEITLQSGQDYILHLATADIQHGFHLPREAMGQSVDILLQPNKKYQVNLRNLKPGVYPIGCTEYCGIEHNKMRTKLIVLE